MKPWVVHILTHNRKETLRRCLRALFDADVRAYADILVVDNASTDQTETLVTQEFPDVDVLLLDENYGVSRGRNRGLAHRCAEWNIFIDDDCIVEPDFFRKMEQAISREDAGDILTFHIIQDDTEEITCWSYYPPADQFHMQRFESHIFSGGGCAIRRAVFQDIGTLSEAFPFCGEEVDYSLRALAAGYHIVYEPMIIIRHVGLARHPIPTERDLLHIKTVSYFYFMLLPGWLKWRHIISCLLSCQHVVRHFGMRTSFMQIYSAWKKARRDGPTPLSPSINMKLKRLQKDRPGVFTRIWQKTQVIVDSRKKRAGEKP